MPRQPADPQVATLYALPEKKLVQRGKVDTTAGGDQHGVSLPASSGAAFRHICKMLCQIFEGSFSAISKPHFEALNPEKMTKNINKRIGKNRIIIDKLL